MQRTRRPLLAWSKPRWIIWKGNSRTTLQAANLQKQSPNGWLWRAGRIVEDDGLRGIIHIASNDWTYELPCRATTTKNIHDLYEDERAKEAVALGQTSTVALTGDYWTSLSNHSYLVTAHYFDDQWGLQSRALTVMKTEERHFASTCTEHFMHVAREWNIEDKVSTLTTNSARNMIAVSKELPFEHMPCTALLLQRAITVSLQHSPFDNALAKCRKVVGHFKQVHQIQQSLSSSKLQREKLKRCLHQMELELSTFN